MLLADLLREDFHLFTRDSRGNWLTNHVAEIMADVDGQKTILKQSPSYAGRYRDFGASLTVYPEIFPRDEMFEVNRNEFCIEIFGDQTAIVHQTYEGEAIPVIRFILSRWPEYGDVYIDNLETTFAEYAATHPPRLRDQQEWYHGTTTLNLPHIKRFGMMPRDVSQRNYRGLGGSEPGTVYLAADAGTARGHAERASTQFGGAPVVLKIDLRGLEGRIVDDHDVRFSRLGKRDFDLHDKSAKRVRNTPGESSYLTLGTVGFRGRIPPSRISVLWQGDERKGRAQKKADHYQFLNALGDLVGQLDKGSLEEFFHIIGVRISGYRPQPYYADEYYEKPVQTLNSVYATKTQPAQFARWLRGMKIRAAKWRRRAAMGLAKPAQVQILQLIDQETAKVD